MDKIKSRAWIPVVGCLFCAGGISLGPNGVVPGWRATIFGACIIAAWVLWAVRTVRADKKAANEVNAESEDPWQKEDRTPPGC